MRHTKATVIDTLKIEGNSVITNNEEFITFKNGCYVLTSKLGGYINTFKSIEEVLAYMCID